MNKFKVEQVEASSYNSSIYKCAGSVHDDHYVRSPSQLLHLGGKTSGPANRLNQSNEYASPTKSDSTCVLPKISSVIGNVTESHQPMDQQQPRFPQSI